LYTQFQSVGPLPASQPLGTIQQGFASLAGDIPAPPPNTSPIPPFDAQVSANPAAFNGAVQLNPSPGQMLTLPYAVQTGTVLLVGNNGSNNQEMVVVQSVNLGVTPPTIKAVFTQAHSRTE